MTGTRGSCRLVEDAVRIELLELFVYFRQVQEQMRQLNQQIQMLVEESAARRKRRLHHHPGSTPGSVKKKETPSPSLQPASTPSTHPPPPLPVSDTPKGVRGGGGVKVSRPPPQPPAATGPPPSKRPKTAPRAPGPKSAGTKKGPTPAPAPKPQPQPSAAPTSAPSALDYQVIEVFSVSSVFLLPILCISPAFTSRTRRTRPCRCPTTRRDS